MMNYYNMRNLKDAPEEPDLCKKQMYQKVSIPEEYYLITVIFYPSPPGFVPDSDKHRL
ncbi:hypothetical protein [Elizabethkingia ursingii]|uniref:hypothetical protein n=1 Tax=Elizabethkingia ursingii TaxID=1756150 RepID=UPI0013F64558|nr:hypothetical protein [Elizabethkingia ursingii]